MNFMKLNWKGLGANPWLLSIVAALAFAVIVTSAIELIPNGTLDVLSNNTSVESSDLVERGRYLALAANCASCHTRKGGAPFSGGVAFETPVGTVFSSNITSDVDHGIGSWSVNDLASALRNGVSANGYNLFPAFPYTSFTRMGDEDVKAIYAFLRTVQPDPYRPPANGFVFRQRWAMKFWNLIFFRPGRFKADSGKSAEWNAGAYLVEALAHCSVCHTPRNALMAEIAAKLYQGGAIREDVKEGRSRSWFAVNLTESSGGLHSWSVDNLERYLHTGVSPRGGTFGPMNKVIVNSTSKLNLEDVRAMAVYIKSLPAGDAVAAPQKSESVDAKGADIYRERCLKCHGSSGRGGMFTGPPLDGSAIVEATDPSSLVNAILYGAQPPEGTSLGAWETMQPYGDILDDSQVADLANYLRGAWGNRASRVTVSTIEKQR